jgi:hypothetical protein
MGGQFVMTLCDAQGHRLPDSIPTVIIFSSTGRGRALTEKISVEFFFCVNFWINVWQVYIQDVSGEAVEVPFNTELFIVGNGRTFFFEKLCQFGFIIFLLSVEFFAHIFFRIRV